MKRVATVSACVSILWSCSPPASKGGWVEETSHSLSDLYAVHAFTRTRILAVGTGGKTVANVDGIWRERTVSGDDTLAAVWGPGEDDVFIVGGVPGRGIVWHTGIGFYQYNGITIPNQTPMLHAVHGTSHQDVWVVGDGNTALHFDGNGFSSAVIPTPPTLSAVHLRGVYCRQQSDCWAVGLDGVTAHWDGTAWTTQVSVPGTALTTINGVGNQVLAAGDRGTLLTMDGATVGTVGSPDPSRMLNAVWLAGGNDAWAAGDSVEGGHAMVFRLEGTSDWKVSATPEVPASLRSVHGVDGNLVWMVGDTGTIYRLGSP